MLADRNRCILAGLPIVDLAAVDLHGVRRGELLLFFLSLLQFFLLLLLLAVVIRLDLALSLAQLGLQLGEVESVRLGKLVV